jgi:diguanylate cyclase (GGDEF)-like protein/PAS domain S-box-containing protein
MELTATGINDCNQALEALKESEERFRLIFEHAPIGMMIADLKGRFVRVNQAMADLLGYPVQQLTRMNFRDITHPEELEEDMLLVADLVNGKKQRLVIEKRYLHRDGEGIYVTLHVSLLRDLRGRPRYFIGQMVDITERKSSEQTMRYMAYHDPLTDLPNRVLFRDRLSLALAQARANERMLAIIFLDLDRFKTINDTMGHYLGDQALKFIAERFTSCVRSSDVVARLGGDEFTILLPNIVQEQDVDKVLQKIISMLEEPVVLKGTEFRVSASVGIALYPRDGNDVDTLLQVADREMYVAKSRKGIEP